MSDHVAPCVQRTQYMLLTRSAYVTLKIPRRAIITISVLAQGNLRYTLQHLHLMYF